jgi:uncharacterized phage protein gp47/JayE
MSFGVTAQGFNRMLESDIKSEIVAATAPLFGVDPQTSDWPNTDSVLSQLLDPFCRQLGIVWEQIETAFEGLDPAQASGTLLDGLLAVNNIARLEASSTQVLAAISGTQGTSVPLGTRLSVLSTAALFQALATATITKASLLRFNVQVTGVSSIGTQYAITVNGHVIQSGVLSGSPTRDSIAYLLMTAVNASSLVNTAVQAVLYGSSVLQVATVTNSTVYSVTLNGVVCTYTSDASATSQEIVDGLVAAINGGQSDLTALGLTSSTLSLTHRSPGTDWTLVLSARLAVAGLTPIGAFAIKSQDLATAFSGDVDSRMAIDKLFSPQTYAAIATGKIEAPAGTLETIETPVTGLASATNFLDGVLGREVQSDDDARIMREETLATGTGHLAAVISQLFRDVADITLVRGYENIDDNVDSAGRPGHSVEFLVVGGLDAVVALTIWNMRAAGITPYGNINADGTTDPDGSGSGITVQDSNGANQVVHFSRPETLYGFINVTKTLYSEEEYPTDGDDAVSDALLAYGNSLDIGKDLLNQRFTAAAVNIPGVGSLAITIALSHDPDNAPIGNNNPVAGDVAYTASNIAVGIRQRVLFDSSRIVVT